MKTTNNLQSLIILTRIKSISQDEQLGLTSVDIGHLKLEIV
jgi:hypothetical protein